MIRVALFLALGLAGHLVRPALAQLPDVVSYQGYVEQAGEPVNDPAARLVFKVYQNAEGGTALWTEQHLDVPVVDGVFSVLLGSVTPAGFQALPFGESLWLGINLGSGELTPRTALVAVPYSLHSRSSSHAGSLTGLRVVETTTEDAPSIIAGHASNDIAAGVDGATISGGGYDGGSADIWPNRVEADYGTIGGGRNNTVTEFAGTVGGGTANVASGDRATVAGGRENTASELYSTVGGGVVNSASGKSSTVGGGGSNTASDDNSTVGGGGHNTASGLSSTVGGGGSNTASGLYSTVGGGQWNAPSGSESTVGGGTANTASGDHSTAGGGFGNTASGDHSTVPGGILNQARGNNSFAAGYQARARHGGSFVWSGAAAPSGDSLYTTSDHQFLIRATGGVGVGTNAPAADVHISGDSNTGRPLLILQETGNGDYARLQLQNSDAATEFWHIAAGGPNTDRLNFWTRNHNVVTFWPHGIDFGGGNLITTSVGAVLTQGGMWQNNSSRASKRDFQPLDTSEILNRVAALPVLLWRYDVEAASTSHVGPVAEDFYAVFGLGTDESTIGTADADGVALAAIQGLYELVKEQQGRMKSQSDEIGRLQAQMAALQSQRPQ